MAINTKAILTEFKRIASEEVGEHLSTYRKSGQNVPTVITERPKDLIPETPYITVDILTIDDSGSWLNNTGVDENDNPFFASYFNLLLQYTVYGDNSLSIAQDLKGRFRIGRVLDAITTNTGAGLKDVFNVNSLPQKLATDYLEVASFNLSVGIADVVTDIETGIIETIVLTGEVDEDPDEEDNALQIDISVTCPTP